MKSLFENKETFEAVEMIIGKHVKAAVQESRNLCDALEFLQVMLTKIGATMFLSGIDDETVKEIFQRSLKCAWLHKQECFPDNNSCDK